MVKQSLRRGGLGLRFLVIFNRAFQGKWLWRFMMEQGILWRRIIEARDGVDDHGWFSKILRVLKKLSYFFSSKLPIK